jgi:hypothetical protein
MSYSLSPHLAQTFAFVKPKTFGQLLELAIQIFLSYLSRAEPADFELFLIFFLLYRLIHVARSLETF